MRFVNSNKDKALLEMATLRYINNELVGLGEKDHLIKITINKDEYEDPHFNIVIGTTIIRIDLDTLSPLDKKPKWEDYLNKKQFNAIIDWAAQNRNLLINIYNNATSIEDYTADFTKLEESIDINKKIIYNTTPIIDSVEIIDDDFILTYFKCRIAKIISIDDLIESSPNYYNGLKDKKILYNYQVYPHCIIWNDDIDVAGSFIWKKGDIVE